MEEGCWGQVYLLWEREYRDWRSMSWIIRHQSILWSRLPQLIPRAESLNIVWTQYLGAGMVLSTPSTQPPSTGETQHFQISKLPEIKLPTFKGTYSKWLADKELVTGLILMRAGLKDYAKLHYLRSSLTGAPLTLIAGFTLCDESLMLAWNTLVARYENERVLTIISWIICLIWQQRQTRTRHQSIHWYRRCPRYENLSTYWKLRRIWEIVSWRIRCQGCWTDRLEKCGRLLEWISRRCTVANLSPKVIKIHVLRKFLR